ncbi:MAG: hypothetical protein KUL83_05635 [Lentimicrobium sp.]|jgi:hypothetical protein|nr:hypothetical protein [Lentimicrobium sp.]MDD2527424.1 DUF5668 domain-containing protein [Lentimicrobiaceae bacterium]MDD4597576.1 DUF5668 domain-containing protein [Lentimicrobiaceae bacterium]MDY0026610.1 DUF5668 domain-containing protein [Lentimicrobium sp.]
MSYKKIFWGVILVIIGTLFILKNVGLVYFDWVTLWRLWPLVLILWGISIIPVKDYLKLIFSIIAILLSVLLVNRYDRTGYYRFGWRHSDPQSEWRDGNRKYDKTFEDEQQLFQPYDSAINRVELKLEAAAGEFKLADNIDDDKLLTFFKQGTIANYSMISRDEDSSRFIELNMQESKIRMDNRGNRVKIGLNPRVIWDFDFDIGASSINLDLSNYQVENIDIDGGASSINLKLGNKSRETHLGISAGAASIQINIPETSGAEIKTETALTSRDFKGFNKVSNGLYRTSDFVNASNKIFIEFDAAVSSLSVKRY